MISGSEKRYAILLFAFALLVRLAIVFIVPTGNAGKGDMFGWMETAGFLLDRGYPSVYSQNLQGNAYPPAFFLPLLFAAHLYHFCCSAGFEYPTRTLDIVMRLGPIVADALIALAIYWVVRGYTRNSRAVGAALLYVVNPAVLTTVAWMSMIGDPYYLFLIICALLLLANRRFLVATALITIAAMVKPQAMLFVPVVAFWLVMNASRRDLFLCGVVACSIICVFLLPFVLTGTEHQVVTALNSGVNRFPFVHVHADNFWYIVSGGSDPFSRNPPYDTEWLFELVASRDIGLSVFLVLNFIVFFWLVGRWTLQNLMASAAFLCLGFFVFSTRMHVNYSFPVFALLSTLAVGDRRYMSVLGMVSVACLVDWDVLGTNPKDSGIHMINAAVYVVAFFYLGLIVHSRMATQERQLPGGFEFERLKLIVGCMLCGATVLSVIALVNRFLVADIPTPLQTRSSLLIGSVIGTASILLSRRFLKRSFVGGGK